MAIQRKLTDLVQLKLRFDERLRRRLEKAAEKNDRSMNAEIVVRLERSLQDQEILTEIRNELAAMKKAMQESQDEQYERFLKEFKEEQYQAWAEDSGRED